MTSSGKTKDEKYILAIYKRALLSGDIDAVMDKYEVGKEAGLSERAVDAILTLLMQANFVKKESKTEISLSKQGEELAKRLLEQK
jgi:Mn-dependent DtxR family transcriptional regulator